jgi:uncharacterized delta-60 repeat protein
MIFFLVLIGIQIFALTTSAQVSEEWVQRFTSDSIRNESVNDMFVDADGNVYVTGAQRQTNLNLDIQAVTVKYNSQGVQQWIQNYVSQDNNGAFTRAIYVDAAENVYVTGETEIYSGGANKMLVIKYSPDGTQLWSNRFQYVNGFYAGGYDIVTDLTGNVYVTGEYGNGGNNIFLVKFDSDGNLVNQTFYNSSGEGGRKISLDGAGKIIIGGYVNDNDSLSFIALKYEQNLDFVWASRYGQGIAGQEVIDMSVDINSNIILTSTNIISTDYETVKIGSNGVVEWSKLYNSTSGWDFGRAVVTDNFGNVYVTGHTGLSGFPLFSRMTTIKYSPEGEELWMQSYADSLDGWNAKDIAIDNSSNLYVVGWTYNESNIAAIKYNSEGSFQWSITYNGPGNSTDNPSAIDVDPNGNVYTTGNSFDESSGYDIAVIKYTQAPTNVESEDKSPSSFSLKQNYPNPFNPSTKISWQSPVSSWQTLKVYNVLGKEVVTLVNEYREAGSYTVNFDASTLPSGVYIYKLQAGDFTQTRKMTLVK